MSILRERTRALVPLFAVLLAVSLVGCGAAGGEASDGVDDDTMKVGLLLPEALTPRYELFDHPIFEATLKEECPDCEFLYGNAAGEQTTQQNQAEAMIAQGVDVIALSPVDAGAAKAIVDKAKAAGVIVLGYGRISAGPVDYQVLDELLAIGETQGRALVESLDAAGTDPDSGVVVILNGDAKTFETGDMKAGREPVLDGVVEIGREYFIENWDPATAQTNMDQAITALGKENIIGVLAMNDGIASGVITALQNAGVDPMIPVTGGDADIAAVQRILVGKQAASELHSAPPLAKTGATVAAQLAKGEKVTTDGVAVGATGNEIPAIFTPPPVIVTIDTIQSLLLDTGIYTLDQICTAEYADACAQAGLK